MITLVNRLGVKMGSPYGAVYGLGAVGSAGIPEAYASGQMDAAKLEEQKTLLQGSKLSLRDRQVVDQVVSVPYTDEEKALMEDPKSKLSPNYASAVDYEIRANRAKGLGAGHIATAYADQSRDYKIKAGAEFAAGAAQALEAGDFGRAKQMFGLIGSPVESIEPVEVAPGEMGGWKVWYQGQKEPIFLDRASTAEMGKPGGAAAMIKAQITANASIKKTEKTETGKTDRQQKWIDAKKDMAVFEADAAMKRTLQQGVNSSRVAGINAGAKMGATQLQVDNRKISQAETAANYIVREASKTDPITGKPTHPELQDDLAEANETLRNIADIRNQSQQILPSQGSRMPKSQRNLNINKGAASSDDLFNKVFPKGQ
jgi:hypothetical protein